MTPPPSEGKDLRLLLGSLKVAASESVRLGSFVNSEPSLTPYWIDLRSFEERVIQIGRERLTEAVRVILDRLCAQLPDDLLGGIRLLNLCTEESGISSEFTLLRTFAHELLENVTLETLLEDDDETLCIVITPFDSYGSKLKEVVGDLQARRNHVVAMVTVFSVASTWDFVPADWHFSVMPLFRVVRERRSPTSRVPVFVESLYEMRDFGVLMKWLASDAR